MAKQAIPFKPFDPKAPYRIYWNRLPHWRQSSCTYFVTFRLADSIPASALRELSSTYQRWLKGNGLDPDSEDFHARYQELPHGVIKAFHIKYGKAYNKHLDSNHGACLLNREEHATIIREALFKFDGLRMHVGDFTVMPNHVHILLQPIGDYRLEKLVASIKGVTAKRINARSKRTGPLWFRDSFDHIVRKTSHLERFQTYIRENPKHAGIQVSKQALYEAEFKPRV